MSFGENPDVLEIGWEDTPHYVLADMEDDLGKYRVDRNQATTVIDRWMRVEHHFDYDECIAIWFCMSLWERIGALDPIKRRDSQHRKVSYWATRDDFRHARALTMVTKIKRSFSPDVWHVFENVVRWNEPTGVPGSKYALVRRSAKKRAIEIVRYVAGEIYDSGIIEQA